LFDLYKKAGCVIKCHEVRVQHEHMPSRRFYMMYEEDKKAGVFPVPGLDEQQMLIKAKELHDA
jgi:hypothetical protein